MKVTLYVKEIQAAMLFASHDESRPAICGVRVETFTNKPPLLVATDGKRLLALQSLADNVAPAAAASAVLHPRFLRAACLACQYQNEDDDEWVNSPNQTVTIETDKDSAKATVENMTITDSVGVIDAQYPHWRKALIFARAAVEAEMAYNPDFIADYRAACDLLGYNSGGLNILANGTGNPLEVRVASHPEFYSLFAPMKSDAIGDFKSALKKYI